MGISHLRRLQQKVEFSMLLDYQNKLCSNTILYSCSCYRFYIATSFYYCRLGLFGCSYDSEENSVLHSSILQRIFISYYFYPKPAARKMCHHSFRVSIWFQHNLRTNQMVVLQFLSYFQISTDQLSFGACLHTVIMCTL